MPFKNFSANILSSDDVNDFLMKQSVMVFDNATARNSALVSPLEGMVVYLKDVNKLQLYNGTAWVVPNSPAQNPTGLEFITTASFSAITVSTPLNIVSCFNDTYLNYIAKVTTSGGTGDVEVVIQLLSGTTPASAFDYRWAGTGSNNFGGNSNGGSSGSPFFPVFFTTVNSTVGGQIDFYQPNTTRRTTILSDFLYDDGGFLIGRRIAGQHNLANSYDGFRIYPLNGNVTGTISVYGYRN